MNKRSWYYVVITLLSFLFIYNVFTATIIANPANSSKNIKVLAAKFLPEGWGFFTRDPKEALLDIYEYKNGKAEKLLKTNGDYYLGASRYSRIINFQTGSFLQINPKVHWLDKAGENSINTLPAGLDTCSYTDKCDFFKKGKIYVFVSTARMKWIFARNPLNTKPKIKASYVYIQ